MQELSFKSGTFSAPRIANFGSYSSSDHYTTEKKTVLQTYGSHTSSEENCAVSLVNQITLKTFECCFSATAM